MSPRAARAPRVEQLDFGQYEIQGGLSFEEIVAMQKAGFQGSDPRRTVQIQERQMEALAQKPKGTKHHPTKAKPAAVILFEGQDIRVREFRGRDGGMKYAIERPWGPAAALLVELDRDQALKIGRSIHAHGGEFRAAQKSGWSETMAGG